MSWPNLTDLLVAADSPDGRAAPIGLVGAPLAAGSVTPGRCDLAPALLRATLKRIGRFNVETVREIETRVADYGDVNLTGLSIEAAFEPIRDTVATSLGQRALTLLIGGNNAITRPGLHGLAAAHGLRLDQVGLITLDAHFDLRETGGGLSNGNPIRALLEDGLPGANISQNGLAPFANSAAMFHDADAAGIDVATVSDCFGMGMKWIVSAALEELDHVQAIMVDFDIDVIDRSQFPGAPGGRPGGIDASMFFEAAGILCSHPKVRLIDLTEWDPPLDPSDLSALVAGRWLAECIAGFEQRAA